MSVMLSKQLYGQLFAQIYRDLIFRTVRGSRVENVHPYKIICGGWTLRNLGFHLYLQHVYRFLMLNNRFTIRRPIHHLILRAFIIHIRIFKIKKS